MIRCVDNDGIVQRAVFLQPAQQPAYLAVDLGYGGVVADIAAANLLLGRLKAAGQALVALPRMGVVGGDIGESGVFKAGGQIRVMGLGLVG